MGEQKRIGDEEIRASVKTYAHQIHQQLAAAGLPDASVIVIIAPPNGEVRWHGRSGKPMDARHVMGECMVQHEAVLVAERPLVGLPS
jgi:hypothetical protein